MMKAPRQIGNFPLYDRSPGEHNLTDKQVREILGVNSTETLVRQRRLTHLFQPVCVLCPGLLALLRLAGKHALPWNGLAASDLEWLAGAQPGLGGLGPPGVRWHSWQSSAVCHIQW